MCDVGPDFRNNFLKYLTKVDKLGSNTAGRYIRFLKTICVDAKGKFEVHPELDDVKGFSEKVAKIFSFKVRKGLELLELTHTFYRETILRVHRKITQWLCHTTC